MINRLVNQCRIKRLFLIQVQMQMPMLMLMRKLMHRLTLMLMQILKQIAEQVLIQTQTQTLGLIHKQIVTPKLLLRQYLELFTQQPSHQIQIFKMQSHYR